MNGARRLRGFEPLGSIDASGLGLSAVRAKDLELQVAWRQVAGPAIARRAEAVALRRGVLTLSIAGPAWRRVLENLLPELGAKFARRYPALGVTRFQLTDAQDR
jgi:predicted nucleic acid-binding Zn ribbon protein